MFVPEENIIISENSIMIIDMTVVKSSASKQ